MILSSIARSSRSPSRLMPRSCIKSNSADLNGGATLFLTTRTRTREPIVSSPSLTPVILNIQPDGTIEFQRQAAGCGLRIAEHDADFLTNLVNEDHARLGSGNEGVENAQGLAHQTGLQTDVLIADFTFNFSAGHQGGHGVNDNNITALDLISISAIFSAS